MSILDSRALGQIGMMGIFLGGQGRRTRSWLSSLLRTFRERIFRYESLKNGWSVHYSILSWKYLNTSCNSIQSVRMISMNKSVRRPEPLSSSGGLSAGALFLFPAIFSPWVVLYFVLGNCPYSITGSEVKASWGSLDHRLWYTRPSLITARVCFSG